MRKKLENLRNKRDIKKINKIMNNLLDVGYELTTVHEGKLLVGYILHKGTKSVYVEVI